MTDNENEIDPTADTVPSADAPCDVGDCKHPWKHAIPNRATDGSRLVCEEHYQEWYENRT